MKKRVTIQTITNEINTLIIKKNKLVIDLVRILESNASKHKEFKTNLELEKVEICINRKKKEKERLLIDLFNSISE